MKLRLSNRFLSATFATICLSSGVHADSLIWDGNGGTEPNPNGGNGTWNVDDIANWWNGVDHVVWPALGGTDDDAVFGNTAGTVTLGSAITANDLTFNTTGYTITGNILTLNGTTPTITVTNLGDTATISSIISGENGLTTAGAGTLILTGANNYTGGTNIGAGSTLQIGNGGATGALGGGPIVNDGNLIFHKSGAITVPSSSLSGSGNLSVTSTDNSVTITDNLTLGGNIALNAGASGAIFLGGAGGGTIKLQGTSISLDGGKITAGGFLNNDLTLDTSAANGNISINSEMGTNTGSFGNVFNSLTANAGTEGTIFLKPGTSTTEGYIGNKSSTFNGKVVLQSGVWFLPKHTNDGSWWDIYGGGATFNHSVDLGDYNLNGSFGTHNAWNPFPRTLTFAGDVTSTGGELRGGASFIVFDLTGSMTGATTQTIGAVIANASASGRNAPSSVTKNGTGTTILTGASTYTGVTKISAGTLSVATINDGGVAGNLGAATNAAGNLLLDGGTLQYTGATASTNRSFTITAAKTGTFEITGAATNLTVSGAAANTTGALTKTGAGTLTLTGANLYTGATTVKNGVLALAGGDNRLSISTTLTLGDTDTSGKFVLGDDTAKSDQTVAGLSSTGSHGSIVGGNAAVSTLTVNLTSGSNTYAGVLGGAGINENNLALIKSGGGTLILSGNNTLTGMTTVSGGTLRLDNTNALKNINAITFAGNNATLHINAQGMSLGALTVNSGITGANISFTQNSGSWSQTIAGATLGSALTINQSGTTGNNWNQISWSSKITGGTAAGTDALIFNNTSGTQNYFTTSAGVVHDFTGNIRVQRGSVFAQTGTANGNLVIPDAAMLTINAGAGWRWNTSGMVETMDGLAGAGSMSHNGTAPTLTINANNAANEGARIFSGSIGSLTGNLTLGGTGTQEFVGTNLNYANNTALNNGTLKLTNTTAWNSNIILGDANSPVLQLNGTTGNWTFGKVISGGSADTIVKKTGAGTLTLTNINTYTGTTTIEEGTLALTSTGSINENNSLVLGTSGGLEGTFDFSTKSSSLELADVSGNGTIKTGDNTFLVTNSLSPGFSLGELTIDGNLTLGIGATTTMELGGFDNGESDQIIVTGQFTVDGTLSITGFEGWDLGQEGIYHLFEADSISGHFDLVNIGGLELNYADHYDEETGRWTGFFGGKNYSLAQSDDGFGVLTVIPEPATALLGSLGLLALLRRRRN